MDRNVVPAELDLAIGFLSRVAKVASGAQRTHSRRGGLAARRLRPTLGRLVQPGRGRVESSGLYQAFEKSLDNGLRHTPRSGGRCCGRVAAYHPDV